MKINWDLEESVALVDLYHKIKEDLSNETEIEKLSIVLRKRANILCMNIDDSFRNATGIKMKLQNIRHIYHDFSEGLSGYSNIDTYAVELYKDKKPIFDAILLEFYRKY